MNATELLFYAKCRKDFVRYADVCFREFGDRVKYWTTVNEPNIAGNGGYDTGIAPPVRCSSPFGFVNCTRGNSSTEPYLAVHHILLAHASVVKLYRKNYQVQFQTNPFLLAFWIVSWQKDLLWLMLERILTVWPTCYDAGQATWFNRSHYLFLLVCSLHIYKRRHRCNSTSQRFPYWLVNYKLLQLLNFFCTLLLLYLCYYML